MLEAEQYLAGRIDEVMGNYDNCLQTELEVK